MDFRKATSADILQMTDIWNTVKKTHPNKYAPIHQPDFDNVLKKGIGWVCEVGESIKGFSLLDLADNQLIEFVDPGNEQKLIGRALHNLTVEHAFKELELKELYLIAPRHTRAEHFYIEAGWHVAEQNTEVSKLTLKREQWLNKPPLAVGHG